MLGAKRPRGEEELAQDIKKPRECPELPKAVVNHSQNLHLRAPNFTAIDSPNDDDHQNANLGLAVDTQAYPLARTPVHHSLYISAPAVSSEMDCLPQPANGDQMTESNMMEGVISENGRAILTPTSRLSSLAGGAVVNMGSEEQSSDAKEMQVPKPAAKKSPKITMGFRADCEKCRSKVPGHYIHIRV